MPARSLTVQNVLVQNGKAYIRWSDHSEDEFNSKAEVMEFVRSTFDDQEAVKRMLKALALARYLRLDPNMTNPSLINGKTITLTNESNNVGSIS